MSRLIILCFTLITTIIGCSATTIGFAYWNVDALHDTTPSLFYDDSDYSPSGRLNWNQQRYNNKISAIAATLDSMQMPIIAVAGVENESVVCDIVKATNLGYNYIHRTLPTIRGLDIALLYFGDIFQPLTIRTIDSKLHIVGEILGKKCEIYLTQSGDPVQGVKLNHLSERHAIVAGDISHFEAQRFQMRDPLHQSEKHGHGNAYSFMGWYLRDRILLTDNIKLHSSGIYINRQLLGDSYRPCPTYDNKNYRGGISRYLPVFVYLKIPE